jgi:hypothetical protein
MHTRSLETNDLTIFQSNVNLFLTCSAYAVFPPAPVANGVGVCANRPSGHVSEIDRLFLFSLMYINLNGPPIELFDFGYAVQLWLHYANHRVGASAQTTSLQRERALQIQAYPWGASL